MNNLVKPQPGHHHYGNPNAFVEKKFKILQEQIDVMKAQIEALQKEKNGVKTELAKTKNLEDLKIVELKALCDESGIDYAGFGNKRNAYIEELKARGI